MGGVLDFSVPDPAPDPEKEAQDGRLFAAVIGACEPSQNNVPYKKVTLVRLTYESVSSKASFLRFFFDSTHIRIDDSASDYPDKVAAFADILMASFFIPLKAVSGQTPRQTPQGLSIGKDVANLHGTPARNERLTRDCLKRDKHRCVISGVFDEAEYDKRIAARGDEAEDDMGVLLNDKDLQPDAVETEAKQSALAILKMFDNSVIPLIENENIDRPYNAITLSFGNHKAFGSFKLYFEPEGSQPDTYRIVALKPGVAKRLQALPPGYLVTFTPGSPPIDLPSPRLLAIHKAIACILHMSAAGEYIDRILRDLDEGRVAADGSTELGQLTALRIGGWQTPGQMVEVMASKSDETATRLDDYLDDQIQTTADLDRVGGLLTRVQQQHDVLRKQLQEAQSALGETESKADAQSEALRLRVDRFQEQEQEIDGRIRELTGSTANDDAVKDFESRMVKVRRLEIATSYLQLLQEVGSLSAEARNAIATKPGDAVARYLRLQSLTRGLKEAQPAAEGAAPHLMDHVEQTTLRLKAEITTALTKAFQATLAKINWPKKELNLLGTALSAWTEQAWLLLELGEQDLIATQQTIEQGDDDPTRPTRVLLPTIQQRDDDDQTRPTRVLLPLELMAQPLAQRFRYHFFGDKPTNRLDKPEYFLSHILDLVDRHSNFVLKAFQPLLDARCRAVNELELVYSDAVSEWITALLPLALAKSLSLLPQLSSHPQLLSHFIHEVMLFDNTLRDTWAYTPSPDPAAPEWKGLVGDILTTHGFFNTWMLVEKEFALARYRTIRDDPESAEIDYDSVEPNESKPTYGAIRINSLLETITDRYRGLSSFSQKMKFLIGVQLSIFDDYHQYLHGALQAYLASSHTAGRLLQGQSKSEAVGEKGLASLCKIYGSAEFLERKMEDWGDDIFFLELWEELQDRARANAGSNTRTVGQDLTVDAVAAKTSDGALFDETAASYRRLKEAAEAEILRLLEINVRDATQPLASATRHFCTALQHEILHAVILRHSFSAAGVAQLKCDVGANEAARQTLADLGLDLLGENEARNVLKRRVEIEPDSLVVTAGSSVSDSGTCPALSSCPRTGSSATASWSTVSELQLGVVVLGTNCTPALYDQLERWSARAQYNRRPGGVDEAADISHMMQGRDEVVVPSRWRSTGVGGCVLSV
ncbi:hypothetical protein DV735_g3685, partial [Chaetothyriales sp. CBS 134920]